jgi:hypothetical protein
MFSRNRPYPCISVRVLRTAHYHEITQKYPDIPNITNNQNSEQKANQNSHREKPTAEIK